MERNNKAYFSKNSSSKINGYYASFLAVENGEQGKGCETALMNRVFQKAIKKNKNLVTLDFRSDQREGEKRKKFYEKFDYPHEFQQQGEYASGEKKCTIVYSLIPYSEAASAPSLRR